MVSSRLETVEQRIKEKTREASSTPRDIQGQGMNELTKLMKERDKLKSQRSNLEAKMNRGALLSTQEDRRLVLLLLDPPTQSSYSNLPLLPPIQSSHSILPLNLPTASSYSILPLLLPTQSSHSSLLLKSLPPSSSNFPLHAPTQSSHSILPLSPPASYFSIRGVHPPLR